MKHFILVFVSCLFIFQTAFASAENQKINPEKAVTIYWDTSLSMNDKNLEKELGFLDAYFKSVQNANVRLVSFSNNIEINKVYTVVESDWSTLKEALLDTRYEGIALYDLLESKQDSEVNFLFTDGNGIFDKLSLDESKPTYAISSQSNSNNIVLSVASRKSKGAHINLNRLTVERGLDVLGIKVSIAVKYKNTKQPKKVASVKGIVTGGVYSFSGVLEGVTIRVKGTKNGVITDSKGNFSINAKKGDALIVEFLGKKSVKIVIENPDPLSIFLYDDENVLEEVTIGGAVKKKEELVNTGLGKVDKKKVGYAVRTISSDKVNSGASGNISDALAGKMGATQNGNQSIDRTIFRGGQTITGNKFPLIVLDGVPQRRSESNGSYGNKMNFIDPNNVASVTILKGMAASNRYGSEGANGVILITSKTALGGGDSKAKKKLNTALIKNNDYKEEVALINDSNNLKHYAAFKACKNVEEVYALYVEKREENYKSASFFIEVSSYINQWNAQGLALKVLLNGVETNARNVSVLKYVAYKAEEEGNYEYAIKIYQKIQLLKPKDAQSYRDLALVYQKSGAYQKSLDMYNAIFNGTYTIVDFSGLQKSLNSEMKQLVLKHRKELNLFGTPSRFLDLKNGSVQARIVFEWNTNNAEFELQFVNPKKKFFKWNHTRSENPSRMEKEESEGFYSEEFLLDGIGTGEWIINIESMHKNTTDPLVVRYTLYKNYGGANETSETKLLVLNNIKKKTMVSKINF
jgi:TonB-dependent SusC/RagA subfamily outer membrane receptor